MQPRQILLIEDDLDDQEIFLAAIEEVPSVACHTASNGHEGYDQLISRKVQPDVIFLDLNMPLMNGQEFLKKIKQEEQLRDIPVIILTTSSNPNTIKEVKQLGARELITKPGSFTELSSILQSTLSSLL